MSVLSALIVGAGISGQRHAGAQKKLGHQVGVFDTNHSLTSKLAYTEGYKAFRTLEEGLAWADVVHINTPDHLHVAPTQQALERGKPVLCEKPVTDSLKDAQFLQRLAHQTGTPLVVGNNLRLTNTFQHLKTKLAQSKESMHCIQTTYLHDMSEIIKKTPWRKNQDFLFGGGIHAIDLAIWLAEEEVVAVFAHHGIHEKDYHCILEFTSGLTAEVWANSSIVLPVHRTDLNVFTYNSSYFSDNKSGELRSFSKAHAQKTFQTKQYAVNATIDDEIQIFDDFVMKKRRDVSPLPLIDEAVEVLRVVDAIDRSIRSGKKESVQLNWWFTPLI